MNARSRNRNGGRVFDHAGGASGAEDASGAGGASGVKSSGLKPRGRTLRFGGPADTNRRKEHAPVRAAMELSPLDLRESASRSELSVDSNRERGAVAPDLLAWQMIHRLH